VSGATETLPDTVPAAREERASASSRKVRHVAVVALWVQGAYVLFGCVVGFFFSDDLAIRGQGARYDWFDIDFLMQPWGGHLMPAAFAVMQPFAKLGGFAYGPIALSLAAGQSLVAVLLYRTLVRHFGLRWRILPPLFLYLVSLPVLQVSVWWASAVNALPLMACTVLAADRAMRWASDRRTTHLAFILGLQVAALAFFEKSALLVIFIAVLFWALSPVRDPWLAVRDVLVHARVLWIGLVVILVGWGAIYLNNRTSDLAVGPDVALFTDQVGTGFVSTFLPSLLGGPWAWSEGAVPVADSTVATPWPLALLASAVVVATALWIATWGPRSRRVLLAPVLYGLTMLLLINTGRQGFIIVTSALPRYYADLTVVTALTLAVATTRLVSDPRPDMVREWRPRDVSLPVAVVAAVALNGLLVAYLAVSSALITGVSLRSDRAFVDRSIEALRDLGPTRDVLVSTVPEDVMLPLFNPYNEYTWFYAGVDGLPSFPSSTDELLVLDTDGDVVPGRVEGPESVAGPDPCGFAVPLRTRIPFEAEIVVFRHALQLDYLAGADTDVEISFEEGPPLRVRLERGPNQLFTYLDGGGDYLRVKVIEPGVVVCVGRAQVGVIGPVPDPPQQLASDDVG
jgi:hypothetical protein